jgi:branched-chain amino acid aminotransferase
VNSAIAVGIDLPFTAKHLAEAAEQVIAINSVVDGYIRPVSWLGSEALGLGAQGLRAHVAIATWAWPSVFGEATRESGIRLRMSNFQRAAPSAIPPQAKTAANYLTSCLAYRDAVGAGFHDALLRDFEGYVAEGTGANLFLVRNGQLHTPIADRFLNGITRQSVIRIARESGIETLEGRILASDVHAADEVFLTGTAVEVLPVNAVDDWKFDVGPVTRHIQGTYSRFARA